MNSSKTGVHLTLTFTTPLLPKDLDVLSRPVTYLTWDLRSTDGKTHDATVYYDNSAELVVNEPKQEVVWSRPEVAGLTVMKIGSKDQPVLKKAGDDRRIDWGYRVRGRAEGRRRFHGDCRPMPRRVPRSPKRAHCPSRTIRTCRVRPKRIGPCWLARSNWARSARSRFRGIFSIAYDDEYSIEYLGTKLRPYWRRGGMEAAEMLQTAEKQYADLCKRCETFDKQLMADAATVGGPDYADFCAQSYRVAMAGHKLTAAPDGRPMLFSQGEFQQRLRRHGRCDLSRRADLHAA